MAVLKKPFDVKLIPFVAFENARSYEAAVYAVEKVNEVLKYLKQGYLVLEKGRLHKPGFEINYTGKTFSVYSFTDDGTDKIGCRTYMVGHCLGGPNEDLVYVTKKEIREWFGSYRFIKKADVKNLLKV